MVDTVAMKEAANEEGDREVDIIYAPSKGRDKLKIVAFGFVAFFLASLIAALGSLTFLILRETELVTFKVQYDSVGASVSRYYHHHYGDHYNHHCDHYYLPCHYHYHHYHHHHYHHHNHYHHHHHYPGLYL
jgi:hypothetical protein